MHNEYFYHNEPHNDPPSVSVWALPALTAAMLPVASSAEEVGLAHATVLASHNAGRRRVSYLNHLPEGRASHPLAYEPELGAWITATSRRSRRGWR